MPTTKSHGWVHRKLCVLSCSYVAQDGLPHVAETPKSNTSGRRTLGFQLRAPDPRAGLLSKQLDGQIRLYCIYIPRYISLLEARYEIYRPCHPASRSGTWGYRGVSLRWRIVSRRRLNVWSANNHVPSCAHPCSLVGTSRCSSSRSAQWAAALQPLGHVGSQGKTT